MGLPLELLPEETSLLLEKSTTCSCKLDLIVSCLGLMYISTYNEPHPPIVAVETEIKSVDHVNTDTDTINTDSDSDHINWNWPSTDEEVQCTYT